MPKPTDQLQGKKIKIDWDKKPKKIQDKKTKVAHLILDAQEDDVTGAVEIVSHTPRRIANGRPPMQIINPDLEAALDDIATLGLI